MIVKIKTRSATLDALRAIAIILVLGRHMDICPLRTNKILHAITGIWRQGGWVGVDLFFVLSGFLISGLLFNEHNQHGSISFKRFFIRRGFKIYPQFYTMIGASIIIGILLGHLIVPKSILPDLFFLQNYLPSYWIHTWSLAVEEQFYLTLPILLICLSRRTDGPVFSSVPIIFICIAVTCFLLRVLTITLVPYSDLTHLFPFHLRVDSLFFGVLIAYFYNYHWLKFNEIAKRFRYPLLSAGVVLIAPVFFLEHGTRFIYTIGLTLVYLGSGLILMAVIDSNLNSNLLVLGLARVGFYSYSIYLWHMPIATEIASAKQSFLTHWNREANTIIYLLGSILFGILMSKIVELPMLKLRDKLFPSLVKLQHGKVK